jgi:hypothetical protein
LGLALDHLVGSDTQHSAPIPAARHVAEASPPKESESVRPPVIPSPQPAPELEAPYQVVTLPVQDPVSGETESVAMSVVPQEYLGEGWPYQLPSVLPDDVVRMLQQRGNDVVQQRHLVPFQAADGRRVVFPVDEVQIVPVANRGYQ